MRVHEYTVGGVYVVLHIVLGNWFIASIVTVPVYGVPTFMPPDMHMAVHDAQAVAGVNAAT